MRYRQLEIADAIRDKIASGEWEKRLPTALAMAKLFGANVKTVNKAVHRLVAAGLLGAKPKSGIVVTGNAAQASSPGSNGDIEVLFEGYTAVLSHPFWREIWVGLLDRLCAEGYRPVLRMLESDRSTGLLKLNDFHCSAAAGRVVLGISEHRFFRELDRDGTPYIAACDPLSDSKVPQVSFDFRRGIRDAVGFLRGKGCRRIAFIGQTRTLSDSGVLEKFRAYCAAIQEYEALDAKLIADTRPLAGGGAAALELLLAASAPDAIIAAYDAQVPEILAGLKKRGLKLRVVGCDGIDVPGLSPIRPMVAVPLRRCGSLAAENLIRAIASHHRVRSDTLEAEFSALADF